MLLVFTDNIVEYYGILASCYNGNIYLLTPPNLDFYLEDENNELM